MTWNSTWPLGSVSVKANRLTGNQNTSYIESTLKVNHYFNEVNAGKHKRVVMPQVTTPTILEVPSGQVAIYGKTGLSGSEMWFVRDGVLATDTSLTSSRITSPVTTDPGSTWLAGGFIKQMGSVSSTTSGDIIFAPAYLVSVHSIQTTPYYFGSDPNGGATIAIKPSLTGFHWEFITSSGAYAGFYWEAIGI